MKVARHGDLTELEEMARGVCQRFGWSLEALRQAGRQPGAVEVRRAVIQSLAGYGCSALARCLHRHHSTIIYHMRAMGV
jgi:hypothetical protein